MRNLVRRLLDRVSFRSFFLSLLIWTVVPVVALAVPQVSITNLNRPGSVVFQVGELFRLDIANAQPNQPVY
jgi:hypothetical protein